MTSLSSDDSPASTAIVFGAITEESRSALASFRRILWIVDPATRARSAALPLAPDRVEESPLSSPFAPGSLDSRLEAFFRHDARRLPALLVGPEACTAAYEAAMAETQRLIETHRAARFTRQQDGFTWQKHLLANARAFLSQPLPAHWAGQCRDIPALIVGAGPSLEASAAALVAAAPGAIVFSADSSLRALAKLGIAADFAVTIDIAKEPAKCLPPGVPMPGHVALASVSPPAWQTAVPADRLHFLAGRQVTEDWFAALGAPRPPVPAIENCGATAIELATWLGCSPLYLFGLDLAVADDQPAQRHHADADASLYRNSNYDASARLPRVPGNYVETVPTFALGDWHALDERLAARPAPSVINVTDRGARFRGTTLVHPSDFSPPPPLGDKAARLAKLTPIDNEEPAALLAQLETTRRQAAAALPELRKALKRGGPAALVPALGRALCDPQMGRLFGAYTLKLMPHLMPPLESSPVFWRRQLDEWSELTRISFRSY